MVVRGAITPALELSKLWNKYIPIFLKYNIPLTIFYGTLLGYHREQNFIENDDDIDIILDENYYDKIMEIIKYRVIC